MSTFNIPTLRERELAKGFSQTALNLQQAAETLGVSLPYLVGLLDGGEIPFQTQGNHRIIQRQDLLEYEKRSTEERKAVLAELVADAQELNMGY